MDTIRTRFEIVDILVTLMYSYNMYCQSIHDSHQCCCKVLVIWYRAVVRCCYCSNKHNLNP